MATYDNKRGSDSARVATLSGQLAQWCLDTPLEHIPADVVEASKLRLLDFIGLALAGRSFDVGQAALRASVLAGEAGTATIIGDGALVPAADAAFANGILAEAIEFDDSHNETVVHVSSPLIAAALACAEATGASGRDLLRAVALGAELTCRIAVGAPGAFHPLGFHPTGIFGTFGAAAACALLMRATPRMLTDALGLAGSFASGILESWADGTWGKLAHPGWSAQAGLRAARLAAGGFSGPATVLEGKAGLFATHLQAPSAAPDLGRIVADLGTHWESRAISFKPYPNAHVMHGVLDAVRGLLRAHAPAPGDIAAVHCTVAPYMVGLVCEPAAEKVRPRSPAHARISLAHSVAELIVFGRMDVTSYSEAALADPSVQDLAGRVSYQVNTDWVSRAAYPGGVRISLRDGSVLERTETANLGSAAKPMSAPDIEEKFRINAGLDPARSRADAIIGLVWQLEALARAAELTVPCRPAG